MCRRVPYLCVVGPQIAKKLAENADNGLRRLALNNLALTERIRGRRDILSAIAFPQSLGLMAAASTNGLSRTIYTAGNGTQLPGTLVRKEGRPASGDAAADEAYDGLGATYQLYKEAFNRNSLDDNGLPLRASVHFGQQYDNAEWDGTQMLFGDGDGQYFNRFTLAVDVIGHELTHGVTQYTCALEYHDQSGALNESMSDIFGSMVKQHLLDQTADKADWLIGAGLFTSQVQGGDPTNGPALRNMLKPGTAYDDPVIGKDPQPDSMRGYVNTQEDNGGVHTNSGITNRAFALAAINIGGNSWEGAGQIWYQALLRLTSTAQFQDLANLTYQIAGESSFDSSSQHAVADAWSQVGIRVSGTASPRRRPTHRTRHASTMNMDHSGDSNGADNGSLVNRLDKLEATLKKLVDQQPKKVRA